MRKILIGIAFASLAASSAAAGPLLSADKAGRDAAAVVASGKAARVLYVCDTSTMTRRSFERTYGEVVFVTAKDALESREAWASPRCIKSSEAQRLKRLQTAGR